MNGFDSVKFQWSLIRYAWIQHTHDVVDITKHSSFQDPRPRVLGPLVGFLTMGLSPPACSSCICLQNSDVTAKNKERSKLHPTSGPEERSCSQWQDDSTCKILRWSQEGRGVAWLICQKLSIINMMNIQKHDPVIHLLEQEALLRLPVPLRLMGHCEKKRMRPWWSSGVVIMIIIIIITVQLALAKWHANNSLQLSH